MLAPLLLVNLVLVAETGAGLKKRRKAASPTASFSAVIIVPAHNEARVIGRTLERLKRAFDSDFRILVVADNCTDDTALIAREACVAVIERHDTQRRGKGHALAFARDSLREAPPSMVIVLDADCHTDGDSLRALAGTCASSLKPCQAVNLLEAQPTSAPMVQISTFAFLLKNLVRQRGLAKLTGGVHLTGTGMCLPWLQFEQADLATSSIVEDVRLGLELARAGAQPQLVEDAFVWSAPSDTTGTLTQRRRWEGGLLATAREAAPLALRQGLRNLDPRAVLSGLDLLVPPLAMLVLLDVGALVATTIFGLVEWTSWLPTILMLVATAMVGGIVLVAWWREGRGFLTPQALIRLPLYVLWKVPMYLGLAIRGAPSDWLQSERPLPRKDQ